MRVTELGLVAGVLLVLPVLFVLCARDLRDDWNAIGGGEE
jgi:hypothetical protein